MEIILSPRTSQELINKVVRYVIFLEQAGITVNMRKTEMEDDVLKVTYNDYEVKNAAADRYLRRQVEMYATPIERRMARARVTDERRHDRGPGHHAMHDSATNPDAWSAVTYDFTHYEDPWHASPDSYVLQDYQRSTVIPLTAEGEGYEATRISVTAVPEGFHPDRAWGMRF